MLNRKEYGFSSPPGKLLNIQSSRRNLIKGETENKDLQFEKQRYDKIIARLKLKITALEGQFNTQQSNITNDDAIYKFKTMDNTKRDKSGTKILKNNMNVNPIRNNNIDKQPFSRNQPGSSKLKSSQPSMDRRSLKKLKSCLKNSMRPNILRASNSINP